MRMKMIDWATSNCLFIESGSVEPRSAVGSAYLFKGAEIYVITWRGTDEWISKWKFADGNLDFESIKSPEGVVINWAKKANLKRFIPRRHISIIRGITSQSQNWFLEKELM
jgi:hypothetical protein